MLTQPIAQDATPPTPVPHPAPHGPARYRLPTQRSGITVKAEHAGLKLYVTVNFFENNQPGELFIRASKQGSFLQTSFDMLALHASYLLQHDIPLSWLCGESGKWRHIRTDPMIPGPTDGAVLSVYDTLSNAIMAACSTFGSNPSHGCSLPPTLCETPGAETPASIPFPSTI